MKRMPLVPLEVFAARRNLRRLFLGAGTIRSTALRAEIVHPEETEEIKPAVFLPGQLEKIRTAVNKTVEAAIEETKRREVVHAATIAYHIHDAVLVKGSIYSETWKYFLHDQGFGLSRAADVHIETAALTSTVLGIRHFGHWLKDDCVQYLLAERYGQPLTVRHPLSPHESQYAEYFEENWYPIERARVDKLIVFQDYAQNSLKRHRYETLTNRIAARLPAVSSPPFVYLRRGNTGVSRLAKNEPEIIETLAKRGFVIVDIVTDSLQQILSSLMNARIVVSIEGSHICHCWFSAANKSGVITLQPPDRFAAINRGWIQCASARFGLVVGDVGPYGTYLFSPSDILRTVDLMLAEL
jgi:hypothetical protein